MMALMVPNEVTISPEIINAAYSIKNGVFEKVNKLLNDPTYDDIEAVWEKVTHHGHLNPKKFVWGDAGKKWAKALH